jgi:hypothetical protein
MGKDGRDEQYTAMLCATRAQSFSSWSMRSRAPSAWQPQRSTLLASAYVAARIFGRRLLRAPLQSALLCALVLRGNSNLPRQWLEVRVSACSAIAAANGAISRP